MTDQLLSYHNDKQVKQKYVTRMKEHMSADELIKNTYWENNKGCAVGCTIHSSEHNKYEKELGIPTWLAMLEDTIFEGLPIENAKTFPLKFLTAIPLGVTREQFQNVYHDFCVFILEDVLPEVKDAKCKKVIAEIIELHRKKEKDESAWSAARSAAWSAAWSAAESAAESAARSAAWSAARSAAWSAARSAARSAAESAAESAARSAAESAARSAAESAAYVKIADKLIELLTECKK